MANIEEVQGAYGGVKTEAEALVNQSKELPTKTGFWNKVKAILFYEIKFELTPYQQKVEDEINEFLHQEITWEGIKNFLFQDITFGKKKTQV